MGSEVEVTFCSKDKGKKRVLDGVLLWLITSQLTNYKWPLWDKTFEADKLKTKPELRVMMTEL